MRHRLGLAVVALFCWVTVAPAQEGVLDLIPQDAGAAFGARNVKELRQKGEDVLKEMKLKRPIRFSDLFAMVYAALGIDGAVDETQPAAVVVVSAKSIGARPFKDDRDLRQLLVVVLPFKDRDQIGSKFGFKKGALKANQVQEIPSMPGLFGGFTYVRGKHLYLSENKKAAEHAAKAKRFGANLTAEQRKRFGQADLVLQLGTVAWGSAWEEGILKEAGKILGEQTDPAEKAMADKVVKAMAGIRFGLIGLHIEKKGLHLSLLSAWEKDDKNVKEILDLLRYGDTPTDLKGLPAEQAILAEAAKGNGVANAMLARVLFKATLQYALGVKEIASSAERPLLIGVFNEVWYHLLGNRTALYQNAEPKTQGAIALVAVLDTADGQKFFDHMAYLARIANHGLKTPKAGPKDKLNVEAWLKDLNSPNHHKQELAKLKFRLLGAPALPSLRKAAEAENRAAEKLADEISKLAEERKNAFGGGNWFHTFRPTLERLAKKEKRAGLDVFLMKVHLPKQAKELATQMKELFGPDWATVRFVPHGKNVVVLLGSNTALLDRTLKNVKDDKPGLAESKAIQRFYPISNASRRVEFHLEVAKLLALTTAGAGGLKEREAEPLSSLGLSVDPGTLQLDVWVPLSEVHVVAQFLGLD